MRPALLAIAWLAAIAALASGSGAAQAGAGLLGVAVPLAIYRDRRGLLLGFAALGVVSLAWVRWQSVSGPPAADSIAWWVDGAPQTIAGRIASRPEVRGSIQRFTVDVTRVDANGAVAPADGAVLVRVSASRRYRGGDTVRVSGKLTAPPELDGFDYAGYLARRGTFGVMEFPRVVVTGHESSGWWQGWLEEGRGRAREALWSGLPATQAALAAGILLGQRGDIPRDVNDDFNRAGVSHLIVISGFNIAMVGGVVMASSAWLLGRRRAGMLALAVIAVYSLFVGLTPPVARAALMGSVAIVAMLSGRPHGGGITLLLAAAALTVPDPRIVQDVSFQLSFAATAGLIVLSPWIRDWGQQLFSEPAPASSVSWRSAAVAMWETVAITLAATAATLPLLLLYFGRLSLIGPAANLLLVPLFPLVLVSGAAGLTVAVLSPIPAEWALVPLSGLLEVMLEVARRSAAVPGASVRLTGIGPPVVVTVYAVLGALAIGRIPGTARRRDQWIHPPVPLTARTVPLVALAPAALVFLSAGIVLLHRQGSADGPRVEVFNTPGAPISLITLPGGGLILIDTGLTAGGARAALDEAMRGRQRALSAVVLTRLTPSATGGLEEVLRRYHVGLVLIPPAGGRLPDAVADGGATTVNLRAGMTIGPSGGRLVLEPVTADRTRWQARVEGDGAVISLLGGGGDAGILSQSGSVALYGRTRDGELVVPLRAGETGAISAAGGRVRLHRPAGRQPEFRPCAARCSEQESRGAGR